MLIEPPTNCPSCSSLLIEENSVLYCKSLICPAKGEKLVENFGKTLKILGLGPAAIKKLSLESIYDVYKMDKEFMVERLGLALGQKLYTNISISRNATLNQVLPALGIPLIGKTATDKICGVAAHLKDVDMALASKVLGPKAASSLVTWLETEPWKELPFSFKAEKPTSGKTVCITGKLKSFKTKAEAAEYLENKGYKVVESVTKTTQFLVNESGIESEKTKKASANGTLIVNNILEL
jgi:DNA ligase (NAD+)